MAGKAVEGLLHGFRQRRVGVDVARRLEGEQCALQVGEKWGGLFDCAWMQFSGSVPSPAPEHVAPAEQLARW